MGAGRSGLVNGCVKSLPPKLPQNLKNGRRMEKFKAALARQQERRYIYIYHLIEESGCPFEYPEPSWGTAQKTFVNSGPQSQKVYDPSLERKSCLNYKEHLRHVTAIWRRWLCWGS